MAGNVASPTPRSPGPVVAVLSGDWRVEELPPPGSKTVVVRADRAASRGPAHSRSLGSLVASRRGRTVLAHGYTGVSLLITEISSGSLDDPGYPTRPVGVNTLPVVLLDDAAYAAPEGMDGFGGTWRLTRMPDGTLVASDASDTPFAKNAAAARRSDQQRVGALLASRDSGDRIQGLDLLDRHVFLEFILQVIALLDDRAVDTRAPSPVSGHSIQLPRVVAETALSTLQAMVAPLAEESTPSSADRAAWTAWWRRVTERDPYPPVQPVVPVPVRTVMRVAMNQSWPALVATPPGWAVLGVSGMETPVDGAMNGIAITQLAGGSLRWPLATGAGGERPEGVGAADGVSGICVLWAGDDDGWRFVGVPSKGAALAARTVVKGARHAVIASADDGWWLAFSKENPDVVQAQKLDLSGRPVDRVRDVPLPSPPMTRYHRGVYPIALARAWRGYLLAAETDRALAVASLDETFGVRRVFELPEVAGLTQPGVAAGAERALVTWMVSDTRPSRLMAALVGQDGSMPASQTKVASDVRFASRPVALQGGSFAVAWIEGEDEIRLARVDGLGRAHAPVLVHRGPLGVFALGLGVEGGSLYVLYEDTSRYPFALNAKRVALSMLP